MKNLFVVLFILCCAALYGCVDTGGSYTTSSGHVVPSGGKFIASNEPLLGPKPHMWTENGKLVFKFTIDNSKNTLPIFGAGAMVAWGNYDTTCITIDFRNIVVKAGETRTFTGSTDFDGIINAGSVWPNIATGDTSEGNASLIAPFEYTFNFENKKLETTKHEYNIDVTPHVTYDENEGKVFEWTADLKSNYPDGKVKAIFSAVMRNPVTKAPLCMPFVTNPVILEPNGTGKVSGVFKFDKPQYGKSDIDISLFSYEFLK